MKVARSVLAASALALACGAFAKDEAKEQKGFNEIDKNADGYITKQEARTAGRKDLIERWKQADSDNDGKLSRTEYLKLMAKDDANKVGEQVSKVPDAVKKEADQAQRRAPESASGSTTPPTASGKP